MACLALYFRHDDVSAMRKENVWRQTPDPLPGNFFPALTVLFEFLDLRAFRISSGMAGETQRGGWSSGNRAFLSALVATRAGKVKLQMSLMRKCDRLTNIAANPI